MRLQDHPLLTHFGVRAWPPVWVWTGGPGRIDIGGAVGKLIKVIPSDVHRAAFYIIIDYRFCEFMATIVCDDATFTQQLFHFFNRQIGRPIAEIADLDVSYLL